jgi:alpha,alpha-trehalase
LSPRTTFFLAFPPKNTRTHISIHIYAHCPSGLRPQATPPLGAGPLPSTLLPLPHPTVVPGDRFRETYYWDSLWVLHGLLASGMGATAAGLVRNLMHMLGAVGHVPNGGRGYYLNRR